MSYLIVLFLKSATSKQYSTESTHVDNKPWANALFVSAVLSVLFVSAVLSVVCFDDSLL
jgi:hypothetical protein